MSEELLVLFDIFEDFERHVATDQIELDVVATVVVDEPSRTQEEAERVLAFTPQDREIAPSSRQSQFVVFLLCQIRDSSSQVDEFPFLEVPRGKHSHLNETRGISSGRDGSEVLLRSSRYSRPRVLVSIRFVKSDSAIRPEREDVPFRVVREERHVVPFLRERVDAGEFEESFESLRERHRSRS